MKKARLTILVLVACLLSLPWLPASIHWLGVAYEEISFDIKHPEIKRKDVLLAENHGYNLHCSSDRDGEIAYCTYCGCENGAGYTKPFGGGV